MGDVKRITRMQTISRQEGFPAKAKQRMKSKANQPNTGYRKKPAIYQAGCHLRGVERASHNSSNISSSPTDCENQ